MQKLDNFPSNDIKTNIFESKTANKAIRSPIKILQGSQE